MWFPLITAKTTEVSIVFDLLWSSSTTLFFSIVAFLSAIFIWEWAIKVNPVVIINWKYGCTYTWNRLQPSSSALPQQIVLFACCSATGATASWFFLFLSKRENFKMLDHLTGWKFSVKAFQTSLLFENSSLSLTGTGKCLVTKLQIYQTLNCLFENKSRKRPSWQSLMSPFQDGLENEIARLCLDG